MKRFILSGLVAMCLMTATNLCAQESEDTLPKTFTDVLEKSGLTFIKPAGFVETDVIENEDMNYQYAIKHAEKRFEVRYSILPLGELINKDGQRNEWFNTSYKTRFLCVLMNIRKGGPLASIELPNYVESEKQAVKRLYNADWSAMAQMEVGKSFGQDYKYCVVIAIHKDDAADAYIFILMDDMEYFGPTYFEELIRNTFISLKFK
jgi:hypothetical protein